ncbi:aldo/keto reductase [Streptomyces sp. NPDC086777]|uniref:aldo/keto reductase n=1 Tax=Streptomyces sp. NPDC086777 TaxID=3154866 RepID=UPI00344E2755
MAERVHEIAGERGLSSAQVALAWVMRNPAVTSPIVGVTKPAQLADAVAAVDVELDEDEAAYLEEPYQPQEAAYLEGSFYKQRPVAGSR